MKKVTFSYLALAALLLLIPSKGNAENIQIKKEKTNRTEIKKDTIPASSTKKEAEEGERNVMLNASDANKPREIQIGLPSEDVNVYENGLLPFTSLPPIGAATAAWEKWGFYLLPNRPSQREILLTLSTHSAS